MEYQFPACAKVNNVTEGLCTSVGWLAVIKGFSNSFTCAANNNLLTIRNINGEYPSTNSSLLEFNVNLQSAHTCQDHDYITVTLREQVHDKSLEYAVVSLFCGGTFFAVGNQKHVQTEKP